MTHEEVVCIREHIGVQIGRFIGFFNTYLIPASAEHAPAYRRDSGQAGLHQPRAVTRRH